MASAVSNDLHLKKLMESQDRSSKHSQNADLEHSSMDQRGANNASLINPSVPVVSLGLL